MVAVLVFSPEYLIASFRSFLSIVNVVGIKGLWYKGDLVLGIDERVRQLWGVLLAIRREGQCPETTRSAVSGICSAS